MDSLVLIKKNLTLHIWACIYKIVALYCRKSFSKLTFRDTQTNTVFQKKGRHGIFYKDFKNSNYKNNIHSDKQFVYSFCNSSLTNTHTNPYKNPKREE